jgi:hypothetical protein
MRVGIAYRHICGGKKKKHTFDENVVILDEDVHSVLCMMYESIHGHEVKLPSLDEGQKRQSWRLYFTAIVNISVDIASLW